MANYAYVAKSRSGEETSGFATGTNVDEVVGRLHRDGLVVLHITEDRTHATHGSWIERFSRTQIGHASTRDVALFTRQLATVIESGIPLVRGLRGIAADSGSGMVKRGVRDIAERIERGERIPDAMDAHGELFNGMYISMVRAGERAGMLDKILEQLAVYLEKIDAIKTKVRSAMAYPIFVLIFAFIATLFLMLKIVPTFEKIYSDLGQKLPGLTLTIVNISKAIRSHAVLSALIVGCAVVLIFLWTRTKAGRYTWDLFTIKVPVFGPIVRKSVMSRFARTFGILIQSGLPLLEALELVKGATGNAVVSRAIDDAKVRITNGQGITASFRATRKFPEMVLQMMATGEESGEVDAMLLKVSDFYDRQVEAAVHGLTSLVEPVMVVLVGAMIGVIVVSMFLPIFYFGEAILKGGANL